MSDQLSSTQDKTMAEEVEMSPIENKDMTTSTDKQESTTVREVKTPKVNLNKPTAASTSSGENEENKTKEKEKEKDEEDDKADGYDPFSQESFRPLTSSNQYSMRKTASQALMDVALMMANISQLRTLLTAGDAMEYSVLLIVMVAMSLGFQVLFAILISVIWMRESEQHQKDDYLNTLREVTEAPNVSVTTAKDKIRNSRLRRQLSYQSHKMTSHLNYATMVLVFIITVINMFITGFGIKLESSTKSEPHTKSS